MSFIAIINITTAVDLKFFQFCLSQFLLTFLGISLTRKLRASVALWWTKAKDKFAAAGSSKDYHTAQSFNFIRNWSLNWINYPSRFLAKLSFLLKFV